MALTIRQKGDTLGTFRFMTVYLMETLARWVPSTPELEVKVLFGRHIWDFAQHADALGRRTAELRAPLHYSPAPTAHHLAILESLRAATATPDRVFGFYDGYLPALAERYRLYLKDTDAQLDEPSVRVLERILHDFERLQAERRALTAEIGLKPTDAAAAERIRARALGPEPLVVHRPPARSAVEA